MRRLLTKLAPFWPAVGVVLFAYGLLGAFRAPSAAELGIAEDRGARAEARLAELEGRDAVPDTMHAAELPLSVEVGRVVERLERDASAAGVRSITFDTTRDAEPVSASVGGTGDAAVPSFDAGDDPGADEPASRGVGELFTVYCRAHVETSFQSLCRFLGRVEATAPTTRVRSLEVRATRDGVAADLELETYALPPASVTAAPPR